MPKKTVLFVALAIVASLAMLYVWKFKSFDDKNAVLQNKREKDTIDLKEFMSGGLASHEKVSDVLAGLIGKTVRWSSKMGTTFVYFESGKNAIFKTQQDVRRAEIDLTTPGKICYKFKNAPGHCIDVPEKAEPGRRKRIVKTDNDTIEIEVLDGKIL